MSIKIQGKEYFLEPLSNPYGKSDGSSGGSEGVEKTMVVTFEDGTTESYTIREV